MECLKPAQEFVASLDLDILKMQEEARRDIDRITGIADLEGITRRGEIEARWRRYHESIAAIQKQREAIIRIKRKVKELW